MSTGRDRSGKGKSSDQLGVLTITFEDVPYVIDQRTWSYHEQSTVRAALAKHFKGFGLTLKDIDPDGLDYVVASLWITMRRTNPVLTFDDLAKSINLQDLADAMDAQEETDGDDSPEA